MLSLFPQVLFLSPLVGTLLRLTVGITILYIAYVHWQRKEELGETGFPIIGRAGSAYIAVGAVIEAALALSLIAGYATQLVALLALALSLKHFIFAKKYPRATPLCRLDYFYLAVMSLCLFLMGAGAFAMDWPL